MISYDPARDAPPRGAAQLEPHFVGSNFLLLSGVLPFALATALQDTHPRAACIAGTAAAGGTMLLGLLFRLTGLRRIWPYVLEVALLAVFVTQLVVVYVKAGVYIPDIVRYFPFITNSALGGICLVSLMLTLPLTSQNVREALPRSAWRHPAVEPAAYITTAAWLLAFALNATIYLAPFIDGKELHHYNVLNLLFRLILPILFVAAAAVFTRVRAGAVEAHLIRSAPFDAAPKRYMINQVLAVNDTYYV